MTMSPLNTRLMREIRLILGVMPAPARMPPEPFGKTQLTQLYSKINERYDYGNFNFLPDGARIAHRDNVILIQTGLIQFNEDIPVDFVPVKEKVIDLLNMITEHLRLKQFLTLGIKLICHLPVEGVATKSSGLLETKFLALNDSQLQLLGTDRLGTGFRFHFNTDESYWDLRIEPLFQDLTKLYIEIDKHYKRSFAGIDGIESRLQSVKDYISVEVRNLLEQTL
jgi:hypothetical protein